MEQHTREEKMAAFGRMLDILDELRVKCPWDRKQTNESLRPNTIEETYELCDALIKGDEHEVMKELGDVLLHVAFYAKIGEEKGQFDMADVCNFLCDKLIFRHPHVYGEQKAESVEQVLDNWEQIKQREKDGNKTVLSGVPAALPSLIKAYLHSSRPTAYRTRRAMWASTGNTARTYGPRCVRNWVSWRRNWLVTTVRPLNRSWVTSSSPSSTLPACIT